MVKPKYSNKFTLLSISVFLSFSILGDFSLYGIKPNVVFGIIVFIILIIQKINNSISNPFSSIYKIYVLILSITIIYASLIDLFHGRDSTYEMLSRIFTISLSYLIFEYFYFVGLDSIHRLFINTNIIVFLFNLVLIYFAIYGGLSSGIYDYSQTGVRLNGYSSQSNGFALALIFNFSIAYYSFTSKKNLINFITLLVAIIFSLMTQSRGLIVAIIISIGFVYFLSNQLRTIYKFRIFVIYLITLTTAYSVLLSVPYFLSDNFDIQFQRLDPKNDTFITDFTGEDISSSRFSYFKSGLITLSQHPFGIGFVDQDLSISKVTGVKFLPHNLFITILLNYGLYFGLLWIIVIFYPLVLSIRSIRSFSYTTPKLVISLKSFTFMIMVQLVIFLFTHSSNYLYIWIFIGICISLNLIPVKNDPPINKISK